MAVCRRPTLWPAPHRPRDDSYADPGATDVLVRIEAATTCGTDLKVFLQVDTPA